jgi:AcrR family transcriptional regulator
MSYSSRKPVTQPVTRRGQQTRDKLLAAAEDIFGSKGYDRTSIAEITQGAGVAQGTFYIYFPDKKAVLVELVRELSHSLRQEIGQAVAGLTDRLEIERVGLRAFFDFTHRHRNLYKIVRQAEFVDEEVYRWYYRRMAEGYVHGLSQAMDEGQIRRLDPECLAYCLMGLGDFLGMRWVLWGQDGMPDDVFESTMAFIQRGLAPDR